jgi:hypothetical protein
VPRAKTVKQIAILYTTIVHKNNLTSKHIDIVKTKLLSCKHKNDNVYANKRKNERDNTKMHKMPRHNIKKNNGEKRKHLRRNKPSDIQVEL